MAIIDLPDYGYVTRDIQPINPSSALGGSLGGPTDILDHPGYRYAVSFTTRELPSAYEAREFEALLERANGALLPTPDVSYPWPMDIVADPLVGPVQVNGASPTGAVIPLKGLEPYYRFRDGQPLQVLSGGLGFIHRSNGVNVADGTGHIVLPVYPLTRQAFLNNDAVAVSTPRITGALTWDGSSQGAYGRRYFRFTITERR